MEVPRSCGALHRRIMCGPSCAGTAELDKGEEDRLLSCIRPVDGDALALPSSDGIHAHRPHQLHGLVTLGPYRVPACRSDLSCHRVSSARATVGGLAAVNVPVLTLTNRGGHGGELAHPAHKAEPGFPRDAMGALQLIRTRRDASQGEGWRPPGGVRELPRPEGSQTSPLEHWWGYPRD